MISAWSALLSSAPSVTSKRAAPAGAVVALVLSLAARIHADTIDPSCYGATIVSSITCPGEQTDPAAAVNDATEYAWRVFADINQPAFPGNATDTRRVWETWKDADNNKTPTEAIYLDDGHEPQPWNVKPRSAVPPKILSPILQLELLSQEASKARGAVALFVPQAPLAQEVRTNRPAFNFILTNTLYNQQGQYKYASSHPNFDFPTASKEVKAVWLELTATMNPSDYYTAANAGKTYALVAIHVITKDVPFWHWATFVHKDQNNDPDPTSSYSAPLAKNQTVPPSLAGTPFVNYRLIAVLAQGAGAGLANTGVGAQTDWITRTGEATVMGNPHIEQGFETKSSCITCHAHASIGLQNDGTLEYNTFPLDVGAVNPTHFNQGGVVFYPLDFLWSLRRAKSFRP